MDHESQIATELELLRSLCKEAMQLERRQALAEAMSRHVFLEPEHQIVFESIHALLSRGPVSPAQLQIHLTNRGFPDTDAKKYFAAPSGGARAPNSETDIIES